MSKFSRYTYLFLFTSGLWMLSVASCKKEHSCEGCIAPPPTQHPDTLTTTAPPDTTLTTPVILPSCAFCIDDNKPLLQGWSFKTGSTYLCGSLTEGRFIGDKSTFTLFGPSSCSADTGLRMTVYLSEPLDQDKTGITTNNVAYYYYDNKASKSILVSGASQDFSVTIGSYKEGTQAATGTFNGTVFTSDGSITSVKDGRFQVVLK